MWNHIYVSPNFDEIRTILNLDREFNVYFLIVKESIPVCSGGWCVVENSHTLDWFSFKMPLRYDWGVNSGGGGGGVNTKSIISIVKNEIVAGKVFHFSIRIVDTNLMEKFIEREADWPMIKTGSLSAYSYDQEDITRAIKPLERELYS